MDKIFYSTREKTTYHGTLKYDRKLYRASMIMKLQDTLGKLELIMQYSNITGGQGFEPL